MMSLTDEELKAVRMAEAEVVISRLVAERRQGAEITPAHIEQAVLTAGQQIQPALTGRLMEAGEAEHGESPPICPACGGVMRPQGYRDQRVVTETGEAPVRRAYFYCAPCRKGSFPPG